MKRTPAPSCLTSQFIFSQSEDLSDTKVLIVSTEGSSERIEELQMLGALGYLRKPFTPEEVVEKVADLLKGGSNG